MTCASKAHRQHPDSHRGIWLQLGTLFRRATGIARFFLVSGHIAPDRLLPRQATRSFTRLRATTLLRTGRKKIAASILWCSSFPDRLFRPRAFGDEPTVEKNHGQVSGHPRTHPGSGRCSYKSHPARSIFFVSAKQAHLSLRSRRVAKCACLIKNLTPTRKNDLLRTPNFLLDNAIGPSVAFGRCKDRQYCSHYEFERPLEASPDEFWKTQDSHRVPACSPIALLHAGDVGTGGQRHLAGYCIDSSGAAVAGAKVTATESATGLFHTSVTK